MTIAPFDRMPPSDSQAELAVVACCLKDPKQAPRLLELVKPADFFQEKNAAILAAISAVYERDGVTAISRRAVAAELERVGRSEEVGGATYLAELVGGLEFTEGAEYWARSVARAAFYRRSISRFSLLIEEAYRQPEDVDGYLDTAVDGILGLSPNDRHGEMQTLGELLMGDLGDWLQGHMADPAKLQGIPTGIAGLDSMLDGLQRGSLYILAAETSAGKSIFAHNLVLRMAAEGHRFLVISTEMSNVAVGRRIVFLKAGIDAQAMRRVGIYDRATKKRMDDAMEALRPHPVTIWNPGAVTFANIRSAVRKLRARGGLDVLVIDHIDHVGGGVERRTAELEQLIRQVKSLAETEGIAVLAISHLSRSVGGGKVARLKNSSSKEQDADVVMFLQPVKAEGGAWVEMSMEEAQMAKAAMNWINIRLEVHKNREGMTGAVDLVLSWAEGGQYYEPGKSNE